MTTTEIISALELSPAQTRVLTFMLEEKHLSIENSIEFRSLGTGLELQAHHLKRSLNNMVQNRLLMEKDNFYWTNKEDLEKLVEENKISPSRSRRSRNSYRAPTGMPGLASRRNRPTIIVKDYTFECGCGRNYPLSLGDTFNVTFLCPCGVQLEIRNGGVE